MKNLWPRKIKRKTIDLLLAWVEKQTTRGPKKGFIPVEEKRHLFEIKRDKNGKQILKVTVYEGAQLPTSHGYSSEIQWTIVDEFGMAFLDLETQEQLVILAWVDPFNEYNNPKTFKKFIKDIGIHTNERYDIALKEAMIKLQKLCVKRKLVRR